MPTSVTVTGTLLAPNGTPEVGRVKFQLTHDLQDSSGAIVARRTPVYATLNSSGAFSVSLYATDDPTLLEQGAQYRVTEETGPQPVTYLIDLVHTDTSQDLASITRSTTITPTTATYALASEVLPGGAGAMQLEQPALASFEAALVAGTCRIVVIGDSILETGDWAKRWATWLRAQYSTRRAITHSRHVYQSAGTNAMAGSGTGAGVNGTGSPGALVRGAAGYTCTLTAGQSRTYTPPEPTTAITVICRKSSGAGSLVVKAAGTTTDTISLNNATTLYSTMQTSTPVTAAVQEWTIEASGGTIVVEEVIFHAGTTLSSGIVLLQLAHIGARSRDWLDDSSVIDAVTNFNPHLVLLSTGTNETSGEIPTDVAEFMDDLATAAPNATIAGTIPYEASTTTAADVLAMRAVMTAAGAPRIDFDGVLGSLASDNDPEEMSSDSIHPDTAGLQAMSDAAMIALSGNPLGVIAGMFARVRDMIRGRLFRAESYTGTGIGPGTSRVDVGDPARTGYASVQLWDNSSDTYGELYVGGTDLAALFTILGIPVSGPFISAGRSGALPDASLYSPSSGVWASTGEFSVKDLVVRGLTGSTATGRFCGHTSSGAPTTGAHVVGDWVISLADGVVYVCTVLGTPGTWLAKQPLVTLNTQVGTTYTLAVADRNQVVAMTAAAASTVTIPLNSSVAIDVGSTIWVLGTGAGGVTIAEAGGVACFGTKVLAQGQVAQLTKVGTDVWMSLTATTAATTTQVGGVELATAAEVITGTDDARVSPLSAWASVSMLRPSDALVEAFPRGASTLANAATLTTQRMYFSAIGLPKGLGITGVCFESGATAASAPTNWWFGIFDSSRVALRFTADQLTAAWGANTFMPLALSSGYTTTYAGLYYLVVMVKATTVPTLAGISQANSAIHGRAPIIAGLAADTGMTVPPTIPFTAGALTASTPRPYCYVY